MKSKPYRKKDRTSRIATKRCKAGTGSHCGTRSAGMTLRKNARGQLQLSEKNADGLSQTPDHSCIGIRFA
jgi:hypothetical protein